jgi:hypothetical protein
MLASTFYTTYIIHIFKLFLSNFMLPENQVYTRKEINSYKGAVIIKIILRGYSHYHLQMINEKMKRYS